LARFFHTREYNEACKAFAENVIGVQLTVYPTLRTTPPHANCQGSPHL
jgi:hypothetical protein